MQTVINPNKRVVVELFKHFPPDFENFYRYQLKENATIEEYLDYLVDIYTNDIEILEDINTKKNNITRNITKLKKRWASEILMPDDSIRNIKGNPMIECIKAYEVLYGNSEEVISEYIDELRYWEHDSDSQLFMYPYIRSKTAKKQEAVFRMDCCLQMLRVISSKYAAKLMWIVPKLTRELIDTPIFGTTETMIDLIIDEDFKNDPIVIDEYYSPEEYMLRTVVKNEDKSLAIKIPTLDQVDRQIVSLIYSMIRPGFYLDRIIEIDVKDITEQIYSMGNQQLSSIIEQRIKKIGKYQCEIVPKEVNGKKRREYMMINFFESVHLYKEPVSRRIKARLQMGTTLYQSFLKKATYQSINSNMITNRLAKLILPALQEERLKAIMSNNDTKELPLSFFKNRVKFRYKRDDTVISKIVQAAEQMAEVNLVVKSIKYNKKTKSFTFEFLELSEEEKFIFKLSKTDIQAFKSQFKNGTNQIDKMMDNSNYLLQ